MCHDFFVITDKDIVTALQLVATRLCPPQHSRLDYDITDLRSGNGFVEFTMIERDGLRARLRLDLPSSGKLQPWLYAYPDDADDWVGQLLIWTDEEVFTLGLGKSRARKVEDGESFVIAEPYGWRRADTVEHERLLASAGPFGWNGDVYAEQSDR